VAPDVDRGVAHVVMRAISKASVDRFPSAESFGMTLAERATSAWGPGWLSQSVFSVMASGRILSLTERGRRRRVAPSAGPSRRSAVVQPTYAGRRASQLTSRSGELELVPVHEAASLSMTSGAMSPVSNDASVVELRHAVMGGHAMFS